MRSSAPSRRKFLRSSSVLVAVATVGLSACATFTNNSAAATVDGTDISRDKLESFIEEFAANRQLPLADGIVQSDDARNLLAGMIKAKVYTDFLARYGKPLTKAQRDAVRADIGTDQIKNLSTDLQSLVIDLNAATNAITELDPPSDAAIEKLYNEKPSLTGAMCASHIVVKKKATAQKMLSMLSNGAKFADLAKKYSTEPAAKESGGALQGQSADGKTGPCMSILEYQQNFDPAFTRGALAARAGVPYGPVQSSFGWHVILLAPWDQVKDAALDLVKGEPGPNLATGYLANADITVDPAYGRWASATGNIAAN